ncbi:MAG: hypothetical protein CO108_14910 [Deltaproteobacteria bacterium CG_4_9_14_3_um_filter_63_12]|nr:MAG: hypothetical protein CO108_14910 [Deltaproteobacteria bacterium CG_4_9_14_3_um_filter_63_12]
MRGEAVGVGQRGNEPPAEEVQRALHRRVDPERRQRQRRLHPGQERQAVPQHRIPLLTQGAVEEVGLFGGVLLEDVGEALLVFVLGLPEAPLLLLFLL